MRFSALILLCALAVCAQSHPGDSVVSPEVQEDRTVIFRLWAPEAKQVVLELLQDEWEYRKHPMAKDEQGLWSVTAGPLTPGYTEYVFLLDGVRILDPRNPLKRQSLLHAGASQVTVPADGPAFWELLELPHGSVHQHWYASPGWNGVRRFHVYTPPGYETSKNRYPVLYLMHPHGDTDREWIETGRANLILDNLIALGKAKPMIVVFPDGHRPLPWPAKVSGLERQRQAVLAEKDLLNGVLPEVERLYRAERLPDQRAVAGPGMGGAQALHAGLRQMDLFAYIGVFGAGLEDEQAERNFLDDHERVLINPEDTNRRLKLLWMACGEKDPQYLPAHRLDAALSRQEIRHTFMKTTGGAVWMNWSRHFGEFVQQLFK